VAGEHRRQHEKAPQPHHDARHGGDEIDQDRQRRGSQRGASSDRKAAVPTPMGTASTRATAVVTRVPTIEGLGPEDPLGRVPRARPQQAQPRVPEGLTGRAQKAHHQGDGDGGEDGGPAPTAARHRAVPRDGPIAGAVPSWTPATGVRWAGGISSSVVAGGSTSVGHAGLLLRSDHLEMDDFRDEGRIRQRSPPSSDGAPRGPTGQNRGVHIPAKVDYGMRALLALTARGEPTTAEALAEAQALPSTVFSVPS